MSSLARPRLWKAAEEWLRTCELSEAFVPLKEWGLERMTDLDAIPEKDIGMQSVVAPLLADARYLLLLMSSFRKLLFDRETKEVIVEGDSRKKILIGCDSSKCVSSSLLPFSPFALFSLLTVRVDRV